MFSRSYWPPTLAAALAIALGGSVAAQENPCSGSWQLTSDGSVTVTDSLGNEGHFPKYRNIWVPGDCGGVGGGGGGGGSVWDELYRNPGFSLEWNEGGGTSRTPGRDFPDPLCDSDGDGLCDCYLDAARTADPQAQSLTVDEMLGSDYGGPNTGNSDHSGIDNQCDPGDTIIALAGGFITLAEVWNGSRVGPDACGTRVQISHDDGWSTRYCHLDALAQGILVGARVEPDTPLGGCGTTGVSSGYHLHLVLISPEGDYEEVNEEFPCP